ncbi:MAG: hypothetical protein AAF787_13165 [Chloroflexota bacterium]
MTATASPQTASHQPETARAAASPRRALWLVIAASYLLLFTLAIAVRVVTYERYLPVFEHIDETFRFIHAYQLRDDAPLGLQYGVIEWTEGFPPMQPWVGMASQRVVERFVAFPFPPDYVRALRGLSAVLNVGTTVLLALTGWMLGRRYGTVGAALSGFAAALVWAIAPRVVGTGNLALMDPLIFPMTALALFFTVFSIQEDSAWGAVGALAAVIVAIYTKYVLIYALWLPFCAVAVLVWRRRWRAAPWLAGMAVLSAVTAGWLVFGHNALALDNREAQNFREDGLANMLSLSRNADNLLYTLEETTGVWLFAVVIVAGVVAYTVSRRRGEPTVNAGWLAVLLPYTLGCLMLTSSVDILRTWEPYWFRVRYTLPVAQALLLVWGACVAQVALTLCNIGNNLMQRREDAKAQRIGTWRAMPLPATIWFVGVMGLFAVPALTTNITLARAYTQTHTYETIWQWSHASLPQPEGKWITAQRSFLEKTWNRAWSGYNLPTTFEWVHDANPSHTAPAQFFADGITYFAATDTDLETTFAAEGMEAWLAQLYPIKTIAHGPGRGAETTHFYRLLPPQVQTDVAYGENIALVGYDLNATTFNAGDVLALRPFWQVSATPATNYSMFVHLLAEGDAQPTAQYDGPPVNAMRLPVTWTDPDEVLTGTQAQIALPADISPGDYALAIGLYDFNTGQRLLLPDGTDTYRIAIIVAE